jgi:hypothetical protein
MDIKKFFSLVFKSIWAWIIGGIFALIGVVTFFFPDLADVLNWESLSQRLPWY